MLSHEILRKYEIYEAIRSPEKDFLHKNQNKWECILRQKADPQGEIKSLTSRQEGEKLLS